MRSRLAVLAILALALAASPAAADTAPFAGWLTFSGSHSYIQVPHHPDLNPTEAITIEMWVYLEESAASCPSLVGKDYTQAYWVGVCGTTLRSYLRGGGSVRDAGTLPLDTWVHVAVTSDGVTRRHFINGVQVGSWPAGGPNTTSPDPLRIGSDVSWPFTPAARIDEVRIWRIALSASELQEVAKGPIRTPHPGLVAVWSLDVTLDDAVGPHDATSGAGSGAFFIAAPPSGPWISVPDLPDYLFKVRINGSTIGTEVLDCVPETVCVAGALPNRTEVFIRVIGPRPNGYMHAQVIKFTVSRVEVWIYEPSTDELRYYELGSVPGDTSVLPGQVDKEAFLP